MQISPVPVIHCCYPKIRGLLDWQKNIDRSAYSRYVIVLPRKLGLPPATRNNNLALFGAESRFPRLLTGKGIVGKSAKFELSFDTVRVGNHNWRLTGSHRQEGRGNTAGALLGAAFITGKSAEMIPGQTVNVFTAEDIPFAT